MKARTILKPVGWILGIILIYFLVVQIVLRLLSHYIQIPIPPFLTKLIDNPLRRKVQSPQEYVHWMETQPGSYVLEIGPGAGPFTFALSQAVGINGKVHALDIADFVVDELQKKSYERGITNIIPRQGSALNLPYENETFDQVMMITVFGEIPDKGKMLSEIMRALKPGGKLGIGELFLDPDYTRQTTVYNFCEQAGFSPVTLKGNTFHYLMVFEKPVESNE